MPLKISFPIEIEGNAVDRLTAAFANIAMLNQKMDVIMSIFDDLRSKMTQLVTDVTNQTGTINSGIQLLHDLHDLLTTAVTSGDMAAVQTAVDLIETNTTALASAVAANPVPEATV